MSDKMSKAEKIKDPNQVENRYQELKKLLKNTELTEQNYKQLKKQFKKVKKGDKNERI